MDFKNMKARKVGVFTDKTVGKLGPMKMVCPSIMASPWISLKAHS